MAAAHERRRARRQRGESGSPQARGSDMKIGILDIGTNSIHLVLVEIGRDLSFDVIGRAKDMTRLGDGTLKSGFITREKFERGLAVVKHFVQLARNRGVSKLFGFATAAIREASNGGEFVERLQREAGLTLRTVTGEEECRLIYLAVRHFMDLSGPPSLIIDIGGGSAEFIVATNKELLHARSLKLGGARLKDLFLPDYPVSKGDHALLHRHLRDSLQHELEDLRAFPMRQVIGTSGTLINLGSVISARRDGEPLTNPQGFSFTLEELVDVHKDMARTEESELGGIKGIDPNRKDILLPGACLMIHVLESLGLETVTLCDKAIREGAVLDYIATNRPRLALEAEIPNVRLRTVLQLGKRCEYDEAHAKEIARLSLALFDQLPLPRDLRPGARDLLEYASLLHDIGYHVSYDQHHKHAWYLIKNSELSGFTPGEVDVIACVARFHRKRGPKRKDPVLAGLSSEDRRTIEVLAAVIRVAEALDRSHFHVVESLKVVSRPKQVTVRLTAKDDAAMEIWAARQRVGLLEKLIGRPMIFEVKLAPRPARNSPRPNPRTRA